MLKSLEEIISDDSAGRNNKSKDFDEEDRKVLEKLRNNEIDPEEIVKNLEKHYKGL